jgi:hypothetical protein
LAEFDEAEAIFDEIYARDPYRVDDIDTYSNILYVMEKRAKLSAMAQKYTELDRNRPETCCLVGALLFLDGIIPFRFLMFGSNQQAITFRSVESTRRLLYISDELSSWIVDIFLPGH